MGRVINLRPKAQVPSGITCIESLSDRRFEAVKARTLHALEQLRNRLKQLDQEHLTLSPESEFEFVLSEDSAGLTDASDTLFISLSSKAHGVTEVLQVDRKQTHMFVVIVDHGTTEKRGVATSLPTLTPRETSVLELAASGLRRDMIAHRLNISLSTVDLHCRNIRKKLSARTTSEAVAIATDQGLIVIPPKETL